MGEHHFPVSLRKAQRQVDHRAENAQDKGGVHHGPLPDSRPCQHRLSQAQLQPQEAYGSVAQHHEAAQQPGPTGHRRQHLEGVDAGPQFRGQALIYHRIQGPVQGGQATVYNIHLGGEGSAAVLRGGVLAADSHRGQGPRLHYGGAHRLAAGDKAKGALHGEGQQQPQSHQQPQGTDHGLGRTLQNQAQQQHCQYHPGPGYAQVQHLYKQFIHLRPPRRNL